MARRPRGRSHRGRPSDRPRGRDQSRPSSALWIEGTARGTFTLIGADGGVHRERFDVDAGVLLWKEDGIAFLLQGAESRLDATRLAAAAG
jgi:hypothetical protein